MKSIATIVVVATSLVMTNADDHTHGVDSIPGLNFRGDGEDARKLGRASNFRGDERKLDTHTGIGVNARKLFGHVDFANFRGDERKLDTHTGIGVNARKLFAGVFSNRKLATNVIHNLANFRGDGEERLLGITSVTGTTRTITCADHSTKTCASGTRDCYDNSPAYCCLDCPTRTLHAIGEMECTKALQASGAKCILGSMVPIGTQRFLFGSSFNFRGNDNERLLGMVGKPRTITCADHITKTCASGTRDCYDNSPAYCSSRTLHQRADMLLRGPKSALMCCPKNFHGFGPVCRKC